MSEYITIKRSELEQALEAMRRAVPTGKITLYEWDRAISDLDAALTQQAEPHESSDFDRWWDHALDGPPPVSPVSKETARWIWDAALAQQAELSEGLGPLPPTTYVLARESDGYNPERLLSEAGYTEEHMRAYAAAAVALERDAKQAAPVESHRWEGDHNIESPFNACMHKTYCMTLKQARVQEPLAQPTEPVAMYETDVQLVARLPEFDLLYVQDSQGTRFVEDQDTEFQTELLPVVTYRAQVNAEGYPRLVSGPIAGDAQEPVGEMQLSGVIDGLVVPVVTADLPEGTKLYTSSPQRKPLTEEEIHHATRHCGVSKYTATNIARAVEAALGIKE